MSEIGRICVRPLADLMQDHGNNCDANEQETEPAQHNDNQAASPLKNAPAKKVQRRAATTSKKAKSKNDTLPVSQVKKSQTTKKLFIKDDTQKTIDSYYKSASKNYKIEPSKEKRVLTSSKRVITRKSRRKINYNEKSDTSVSNESKYQISTIKKTTKMAECIIELEDSEDEQTKPVVVDKTKKTKKSCRRILDSSSSEKSHSTQHNIENESMDEFIPASQQNNIVSTRKQRKNLKSEISLDRTSEAHNNITTEREQKVAANISVIENPVNPVPTTSTSKKSTLSSDKENYVPHSSSSSLNETSKNNSKSIKETSITSPIEISDDDFEYTQTKATVQTKTNATHKTRSSTKNVEPPAKKTKKAPRPLPPYKIIEGTNGSMAVDAFRFGDIEGVSHYFLTHFHADHYIGLTRKFAHNIYMSSITARFVRTFIPIEEKYINELELNSPKMIDGIEITAIDANHCPGAIMLIFKLPDGRCMLHTGDFRASADMESEPIFWNNDIHTIYLDTTYISQKYAFCHQSESITRAEHLIKEFMEKNVGTRILFVCGAYLIGKEKFWSSLASQFNFKVFAEGNRRKALNALNDETLNAMLTENPLMAHMHVIPLQKINYQSLLEYLQQYEKYFDLIFALRPSGWEKNSKPQYRGKINIIGIEYSEHSSHEEMKRFVQYLKPANVISTVPVTSNAMITAKIPQKWYKYTTLSQRQYQPSITSFFKLKPEKYLLQLTGKNTKNSAKNALTTTSTIQKENLMLVSPEMKADNNNETLEDTILNPKQEILARVPNIEEPIVIHSDTDDDWLT